jgi:hypothetical protein
MPNIYDENGNVVVQFDDSFGTRISIGAFFDRFGDQKYPILCSDDVTVQAFIKDASVRLFIDLSNEQLPSALDVLLAKGFTIDKDYILYSPVKVTELPAHGI